MCQNTRRRLNKLMLSLANQNQGMHPVVPGPFGFIPDLTFSMPSWGRYSKELLEDRNHQIGAHCRPSGLPGYRRRMGRTPTAVIRRNIIEAGSGTAMFTPAPLTGEFGLPN